MEYTDELLDALRGEGDPLADGVIAQIQAQGQVAAVNAVLRHLLDNDQPIPADLPPSVQAYLRATDNPPAWADLDRIQQASAFFISHGMHISLVLSTGALVQCYAAQRAVKVLDFTHRLDHPQRRVAESAQFCLNMMDPQAFTAPGKFIPIVQKVRLLHAAIRYLINTSGRWPREELGEPICQEDLLGALLLFTVDVLHGLERLDVPATPAEAESYYYVWRVVGAMLGIREALIPATLAEAEQLRAILHRRHMGPSPEGIRLTHQLIAMYADLLPGQWLDGAMPALIRIMIGDEVADWMQVPHTPWGWTARHLIWLGGLMETLEDTCDIVRVALDKVEWAFLQSEFLVLKGHRNLTYDIPAHLRLAWAPPAATTPTDSGQDEDA
ncbi:MAG TPA: oxygenase MpaB family protein [Chloroflexia bacterium]|nr:oxygenase MpaB family protein [Chloroflexia bacterium]